MKRMFEYVISVCFSTGMHKHQELDFKFKLMQSIFRHKLQQCLVKQQSYVIHHSSYLQPLSYISLPSSRRQFINQDVLRVFDFSISPAYNEKRSSLYVSLASIQKKNKNFEKIPTGLIN